MSRPLPDLPLDAIAVNLSSGGPGQIRVRVALLAAPATLDLHWRDVHWPLPDVRLFHELLRRTVRTMLS